MAARRIDRRPHIVLEGTAKAEPFTSPYRGGGELKTVPVDRARHGDAAVETELAKRRRP